MMKRCFTYILFLSMKNSGAKGAWFPSLNILMVENGKKIGENRQKNRAKFVIKRGNRILGTLLSNILDTLLESPL